MGETTNHLFEVSITVNAFAVASSAQDLRKQLQHGAPHSMERLFGGNAQLSSRIVAIEELAADHAGGRLCLHGLDPSAFPELHWGDVGLGEAIGNVEPGPEQQLAGAAGEHGLDPEGMGELMAEFLREAHLGHAFLAWLSDRMTAEERGEAGMVLV